LSAPLGTLSIHLDGAPCHVACAWCYLGARQPATGVPDPARLREALAYLDFSEVAIAVSTGAREERARVAELVAAARALGRPVALTTTPQIARRERGLCDGVARLSLSIDPDKGVVEPAPIAALAGQLRAAHPELEIVLIVSLVSPAFAAELIDGGGLAALVDLPSVQRVALNALKPPPPWCDRTFWLRALARLEPLLARALDRRLFLDCWVAARLLALGDCPARADLTPAADGVAFRSCVYAPAPDFVVADGATLARRLRSFAAPARCPFPY
jgi:hypothetical protein